MAASPTLDPAPMTTASGPTQVRHLPRDPEALGELLRALGGRSYAELARRTGAHPAALKSRAFRARRQLVHVLLR